MILDETRRTSPIGQRVRNIDWSPKTAGTATYTGDIELPGLLHACIVRSTQPHARIASVDASAALATPGVVAIVTADDFAGARYVHHGGPLADRSVLAADRVRYVGEEIAAVAAETPAAADEAVDRFVVSYEPLPAVTDLVSAQREGAPMLHDGKDGNVSLRINRRWGVADAGTSAASVTGTYRFARQAHVCMEPNSVVADWDAERQQLSIWVSTQAPYMVRKELAGVLGLELDQIEVHEVAVGGGFGSRSKVNEFEAIACKLSIKSGRPVRLVLSREEEFATTKSRHNAVIELTTAATAHGELTTRSATLTFENGAYNHSGPSVMGYATLVIGSLYRSAAVDVDATLVYTNKHPGGQFRGYGSPQATFAIESQMDELAERLGIDPIDLRVRNANRAGDTTHTGWKLQSARLVECLQAARDAIGWDEKRAWAGSGRGVGVAAAIHVSGAYIYDGANRGSASIDVHSDGRVVVRHGGADAGTWQKTLLAQFAAEELRIGVEGVEVVTMETARTPHDLGAWSTRGTYVSGHAVAAAGNAMHRLLRARAGDLLGEDPQDLAVDGGSVRGSTGTATFGELAYRFGDDGVLTVTEEVTLDVEALDLSTGVSNISGAYAFAVQAVEVEVDPGTGKVRVIDAVSVHDSGVPINPTAAESQIVGGMAMGLGAALGEDLVYEGGKLVNQSYLNYPLPRAADLPPIRPIIIESHDPNGPYGAKGIGEIVLVPTTAAVANAVAHATGVRIRELPLTPDRVLTALHTASGRRRRAYNLWRRPDRWWIAAVRALYPRGLHTLLHRYGTRVARQQQCGEIAAVVQPASLEDASRHLTAGGAAIAGGTDHLPARRQGLVHADTLVDVTLLPELGRLCHDDRTWRIGAAVRLAGLEQLTATPTERLVAETVRTIASPQIRSMATVAGNLCQQKRCWFFRNDFNCYKRGGVTCPCYAVLGDHRHHHAVVGAHRCQAVTPADLATTFVALDATVIIQGPHGRRSVPINEFYTGPGETVLRAGDVVVEIEVPVDTRITHVAFEKLRLWEGDFAIVSAAAAIGLRGSTIEHAAICVGSVAPTPLRLTDVERLLIGQTLDGVDVRRAVDATWSRIAHPLKNNEWKLDAATAVVAAAIERCRPIGSAIEHPRGAADR